MCYALAMCWFCDVYVFVVLANCWLIVEWLILCYVLVNCWLYVEYVCYDGIVLVIGWLCVGYALVLCWLCVVYVLVMC